MKDFRTPFEKANEERRNLVCGEFRRLAAELPNCAPHRLFRIIAEEHGMTANGVRGIVVRGGLYKSSNAAKDGSSRDAV